MKAMNEPSMSRPETDTPVRERAKWSEVTVAQSGSQTCGLNEQVAGHFHGLHKEFGDLRRSGHLNCSVSLTLSKPP